MKLSNWKASNSKKAYSIYHILVIYQIVTIPFRRNADEKRDIIIVDWEDIE